MNKLYIAYGSNLHIDKMAKRCPSAKIVGTSEIKDYKLTFRGEGKRSFATVEPCIGDSVPILVWQITADDEKELDIYEEWPDLYRKEMIEVVVDEKTIDAMIYIMNEGKPLNQPSHEYYSTILEGYKSAGFNVEYLDRAVDKSSEKE